jgi:transposase-like protein
MEKIGRQRRSESAWRELVDRQEQSGLTVVQFCEREGIKSASLYVWRSRLREVPKDTTLPEVAPKKAKHREAPSSGFIDLGALGSSRSRFEIRLELGHGVLLQLVRN